MSAILKAFRPADSVPPLIGASAYQVPAPIECQAPPPDVDALALALAAEAQPMPSAEELLAQAEAQAQAIMAAAEADVALLREQAWHEGYQAGLAEGRSEATAQVDASVERLRTLAAAAAIDRVTLVRDAEQQALSLAAAMARTIVRRELATDQEAIQRTLEAVLGLVQGDVVVSLHAHPDDVDALAQAWADRARSSADREVRVVGDHRLARGGCRVETATGAWDASLETQLAQLDQALATAAEGAAR